MVELFSLLQSHGRDMIESPRSSVREDEARGLPAPGNRARAVDQPDWLTYGISFPFVVQLNGRSKPHVDREGERVLESKADTVHCAKSEDEAGFIRSFLQILRRLQKGRTRKLYTLIRRSRLRGSWASFVQYRLRCFKRQSGYGIGLAFSGRFLRRRPWNRRPQR